MELASLASVNRVNNGPGLASKDVKPACIDSLMGSGKAHLSPALAVLSFYLTGGGFESQAQQPRGKNVYFISTSLVLDLVCLLCFPHVYQLFLLCILNTPAQTKENLFPHLIPFSPESKHIWQG